MENVGRCCILKNSEAHYFKQNEESLVNTKILYFIETSQSKAIISGSLKHHIL